MMTASGFLAVRVRLGRWEWSWGSVPDLERGRQFFAQADWRDAYDALTAADLVTRWGATDLELLARAAYMLGRDDDYVSALEGAYRAHLAVGAPMPAVRCAFWIGHSWLFRAQAAPAIGWFARAERLLDREQGDVAERGYVLVARMLDHLAKGDAASAHATAAEIAEIGERFGDPDLVALGMMEQGHALVRLGRAEAGVRLIDKNAETAFPRGQRLISGEGAPQQVKVLHSYPSLDLTEVTCLWESDSVESVQGGVDTTLGDSSENICYPVAADQAFAERPLGLPATPMLNA